jgi:hypothetical protein
MALEALTGRAPSTAQAHRARHRARTREARELGVARTGRCSDRACSRGLLGLRHDLPTADDAAFTLAALKDWTFLFGPGLIVPWGNGLILGYLMYKSGLVPRRMAWFGLIGGPLLLVGNFGVLFDWWDQSGVVNILVIPEFIWEAFLGIYCAIWGFRRDSPILSRPSIAS